MLALSWMRLLMWPFTKRKKMIIYFRIVKK